MKMCINRSVQRHFQKTVDEIENLDDMLYRLGELSWKTLRKYVSNLVLNKVDLLFNSSLLSIFATKFFFLFKAFSHLVLFIGRAFSFR